jgi:hypothetical protein
VDRQEGQKYVVDSVQLSQHTIHVQAYVVGHGTDDSFQLVSSDMNDLVGPDLIFYFLSLASDFSILLCFELCVDLSGCRPVRVFVARGKALHDY